MHANIREAFTARPTAALAKPLNHNVISRCKNLLTVQNDYYSILKLHVLFIY